MGHLDNMAKISAGGTKETGPKKYWFVNAELRISGIIEEVLEKVL